MNIFTKATKKKYRFPSIAGGLTTEDLWDLPLEGNPSLESVALDLDSQLNSVAEKSFVRKAPLKNLDLINKLEIVKYVIDYKITLAERNQSRLLKQQQKDKLLGVISRKQDQELEGKSVEELSQMVNDL